MIRTVPVTMGKLRVRMASIDQLANAGAGKDDLGKNSRGQHLTDAHAQQRDRRQDRDRQRIAVGDRSIRQAKRACGADVAGLKHFEHRGAHHAGDVTDPTQTNGQRGQDQGAS